MNQNLPKNVSELPSPLPCENVGKKIIIYGTSTCPDCLRIKRFLADNAIEYEYQDLDTDKQALKWLQSFTQTVPVLIMFDQTIMYSPSNLELLDKIRSGSVNHKTLISEPQVFDTIIVGAGPAGITAAIYAVRKALKTLVLTKDIGGQAVWSGDVENYPGFTMISGVDLAAKFREDIERFKGEGLWIKEGVEVKSIEGDRGAFKVKTGESEYKSQTVIIASGRVPKMLGIPGEKQFLGRGVATCATCDGPLFKSKDIVVVGGGNSALDAAFSMTKTAKSITIVNLTEELRGDQILEKNVLNASNVTILNNTSILEITGKDCVESVKIQDIQTHAEKIILAQGVFIEIGWTPSTDFAPQLAKDKLNQIIVNELGETNVAGIWAAGDVNNLWGEQIIIACGEGAKAALTVAEHIAKIPHQITSNPHEA